MISTALLLGLMPSTGGANGAGGDTKSFFLMLALTFGILYFMLIRPQQARATEQKKFQDGLKKGDHVVTAAGLYGRIWTIEGQIVTLDIAKDVRVKVTLPSITGRAKPEGEAEKEITKSKA